MHGILLLDFIGLAYIIWNISLVRQGRLYVGYGVIFIIAILITMITISVPPLLTFTTRLFGAFFPASALTMLALGFIVLLLIYILTQTTILSNRVAILVQELAIRRADEEKSADSKNVRKRVGTLVPNKKSK
jgi:hypothetical protein